ncbi:predicted protein [Plenodomus lingam JN3]|uniref:Uncharacterized protein n=1 Tax=Leptosphaeria maculans (strain JN3 / isolate v23.1.3 / race Av1-4-5-6-7-8) TaxID=985895 RepID=E4ZFY7_LEPMJ|nr:predicted protein [Plenodomus lingam JN3]CBX90207.1 predicted protein [Plenodomus lingam JN3]
MLRLSPCPNHAILCQSQPPTPRQAPTPYPTLPTLSPPPSAHEYLRTKDTNTTGRKGQSVVQADTCYKIRVSLKFK